MKISLITAVLEADSAYWRTCASVDAQSHSDVEHISVVACGELPAGRIAFKAPPQGVYNALNVGLAQAAGDVVGLLHGGDTFAGDDVLHRVSEAFRLHPDIDYIFGDVAYVHPHRFGSPNRVYVGSPVCREDLIRGIYPPHPSLYIRREAALRLGPYSERYTICGDMDMWVRIHEAGLRGMHLKGVMVLMTTGGLSTRLKARLWTNNREKLTVLRSHGLPASPVKLVAKYIREFPHYFGRYFNRRSLDSQQLKALD